MCTFANLAKLTTNQKQITDGIVRVPQEATCAICSSACSFAFIGSTIRGSSALRKDTVDTASGNLHNKQHINERPTMQQRTIKSANRHSLPRGDLRVDEDTFGCPTATRRVHNQPDLEGASATFFPAEIAEIHHREA